MKKSNWLYILIILFPIIDVITSMQTYNGVTGLSLGMVIKGLLVFFFFFYILFKSQSKYKKFSLIYLLLMFLYVLGYFGFKSDLINGQYLLYELTNLFKLVYLPMTFLGLLNIFDDYQFSKNKYIKVMAFVLIEYTLLLLIPLLLGIAHNSYAGKLSGYVGLFYAANEVSVIVCLLFPFIYSLYKKENKYSPLYAIPIIFVISTIGTKVSMMGCILFAIICLIFEFIKQKGKINYKTVTSIYTLIITIVFFVFINNTTLTNIKELAERRGLINNTTTNEVYNKNKTNTTKSTTNKTTRKTTNKTVKKSNTTKTISGETLENDSMFGKIFSFLLSHRDTNYIKLKAVYDKNYQSNYLLFGMGRSNTQRINSTRIYKLVEIDYIDIYLYYGLFGLIISLLPFCYTFYEVIKYLFKNNKKYENICNSFAASSIVCMTLAIAALAGHILMSPAVAWYVILYLMYILNEVNHFNKKKIKENKVAILSLHMNVGGIENTIVNKANMLAEDKDVEIISLYKSNNEFPYKLNSNVKIKYLSNFISNKTEFKEQLHKKNIKGIIKESFKAIKILYLKPLLIKKYILNSDAKVIISTRKEFSKYLGYFHRRDVVCISEEHNHHNFNKKYIKSVKKYNKNIDYFMPASKELSDFYSRIVKPKVIYIPNVIENSIKKSKCNNKKIVSVGRLSLEKGYDSLINVMSIIVKLDKEVTLDIYGEGSLKEDLQNKIDKLNLNNNIFLKGNLNHSDLINILSNYSLYVCSSYTESFGLSALEAMNAGLPVVYFSSAQGLNEFCNENNSIVIENRNEKLMANKILEVLNSKEIINYSKNAILTTDYYDEKNIKLIYVNYISNVIKNSKTKSKRVLFISSQGGHLNELLQLKKLFEKYDYQIMTEKTPSTENLEYQFPNHVKYVPYGTKHSPLKYFLFILPLNCIISLFNFIIYRPHVIVTTGAHTAGPMCCIGKIFKSKIIYIESFANISTKTETGKLIYLFADVFVVQWEEMLKLYPNAVYGGWIF